MAVTTPTLVVRPQTTRLSLDQARLLPRFRDRQLAAPVVATYTLQDVATEVAPLTGTAGGDAVQLRGIPVQAPGVGGVMANTQPERETLKRSRRW